MDVLPTVKIDTCSIKKLKCAKMLGVGINKHLNWENTLNASHLLRLARYIKKLKEFLHRDTLVLVHNALILSLG